ncbi:MAG: hypothetical protein ABIP51_15120 [Bacteroidia bacterium]
MGTQRFRKVYAETMDRRTFNIVHIKVKTICCLKCKRRSNHKWYHISWEGKNIFPNWKLVSRNKKQWMNKEIKFAQKDNSNWISIHW